MSALRGSVAPCGRQVAAMGMRKSDSEIIASGRNRARP